MTRHCLAFATARREEERVARSRKASKDVDVDLAKGLDELLEKRKP